MMKVGRDVGATGTDKPERSEGLALPVRTRGRTQFDREETIWTTVHMVRTQHPLFLAPLRETKNPRRN